jgi:LysR substrate binding domain
LPQPPYRWVTIAELLDEPFLALPQSAGPLRDFWLALDQRHGHPVRIAAEINDAEETYEAVATGIGICLLAAANAPIFARGDVTMLPVHDLGASELVLAWNERRCPLSSTPSSNFVNKSRPVPKTLRSSTPPARPLSGRRHPKRSHPGCACFRRIRFAAARGLGPDRLLQGASPR